jgi:hypothetical protein
MNFKTLFCCLFLSLCLTLLQATKKKTNTATLTANKKTTITTTQHLYSDQTLAQDQGISSPNGRYKLIMQPDGNLVLYEYVGNTVTPRWRSGYYAPGDAPFYLRMQNDGNLVVYNKNNNAIWATNVATQAPAYWYLAVRDNGIFEVMDGSSSKWSSFQGAKCIFTLHDDDDTIATDNLYVSVPKNGCYNNPDVGSDLNDDVSKISFSGSCSSCTVNMYEDGNFQGLNRILRVYGEQEFPPYKSTEGNGHWVLDPIVDWDDRISSLKICC